MKTAHQYVHLLLSAIDDSQKIGKIQLHLPTNELRLFRVVLVWKRSHFEILQGNSRTVKWVTNSGDQNVGVQGAACKELPWHRGNGLG